MSLPVVDMLTGDEIQEAIVRFVADRKSLDPEEVKQAQVQLAYRNVRLPDGTLSLFATVGLFSQVPAPSSKKSVVRPPADTPIPVEKKDG